MSDLLIFLLGTGVTGFTLAAVLLIGISEGRDPAHSGKRRQERLRSSNTNKLDFNARLDARERSTS